MCRYNFWSLDHTDNLGPLELSSPSNAPGNDKKKIQLPILSNVGKVFQDVYSVASTTSQRDVFNTRAWN